jgi:hypothetical protein
VLLSIPIWYINQSGVWRYQRDESSGYGQQVWPLRACMAASGSRSGTQGLPPVQVALLEQAAATAGGAKAVHSLSSMNSTSSGQVRAVSMMDGV